MGDLNRFFSLAAPAAQPTGSPVPPPQVEPLASPGGMMGGLLNPMSLMANRGVGVEGGTPTGSTPTGANGGAALLSMLQGSPAASSSESAPMNLGGPPLQAPPATGVAMQQQQQQQQQARPSHAPGGPKGVALQGGDVTVAVGDGSKKQTTVTAITIYNTEPVYRVGKLIAVNNAYICYAVKGGSIRVIHQATGLRLLQKGHSSSGAELADMALYGSGDECMLAALAADGDLFVWELKMQDMTTVVANSVMKQEGGSKGQLDCAFRRICWHPTEMKLLAACNDNTVVIWSCQGVKAGDQSDWSRATACQHDGPVNDVNWVSSEEVVSCGDDGSVIISTVTGDVRTRFQPFAGSVVRSVCVAMPVGKDLVIIAGGVDNQTFKVFNSSGSVCTQTLTFKPQDGEPFRGVVVMDPKSEYLLVSNAAADAHEKAWSLFALHLKSEGGTAIFDCASEFSIMYPIISCTLRRDSNCGPSDVPDMHLYCMQTKMIQQYHLRPDHCYDAPSTSPSPPPQTTPAPKPAPTPTPPAPQPAVAVTVAVESVEASKKTPVPAPVAVTAPELVRAGSSAEQVYTGHTNEAVTFIVPPPVFQTPHSRTLAHKSPQFPPNMSHTAPFEIAPIAPPPTPADRAISGLTSEMHHDFHHLEERIEKRIERVLTANVASIMTAIETQRVLEAKEREKESVRKAQKDRDELRKLIDTLGQRLEDKMARTVAEVVRSELKANVEAAVDGYFKSQGFQEATRAAFTATIAPAMDKAIRSQGDKTVDKSVAALKPALQESFKASFQGSIIPAFESSCQNMFEQINATFERGVRERAEAEERAERKRDAVAELHQAAVQCTETLKSLQASAAAGVSSQGHAHPGGLSPSESSRVCQEVTFLVRNKSYEEAFSKVLSLSDLKLVVWLCISLEDPRVIFGTRPPSLSSPVVLSLVQQLGYDMSSDASLKITWLREAVMALDSKCPIVGGHVPMILRDLAQKLLAMERSPETHPVAASGDFRLLQHVIKSMIS